MSLEHGWGSPTSFVDAIPGYTPPPYDFGWGSPTSFVDAIPGFDPTIYDAGWGSPVVIFLAAPLPVTVRDDGGQTLELRTSWPIAGPYQIAFVGGADVYPCYGFAYGEGDSKLDAYASNDELTKVRVSTPRCPGGVFDLRVRWLQDGQQEVVLEQIVTVVRRQHHRDVLAVRAHYPVGRDRRMGPRTVRAEPT